MPASPPHSQEGAEHEPLSALRESADVTVLPKILKSARKQITYSAYKLLSYTGLCICCV